MKPIVILCRAETELSQLLDRLGDGADRALAEGCVFIGTRRALALSERVPAGTEVTRFAARGAPTEGFAVLHEGRGLIAVSKPAHVATLADHHGHSGTLLELTAAALGVPRDRLFATSRLDVGVSGVVVFAASDQARGEIARARREGRYRRHYVAIAGGVVPARGMWDAPIGRDKDPRRRRVGGRDAVPAQTDFELVAAAKGAALLALEPRTGRTHQIRVHASHAGAPLFGDRAYGGKTRMVAASGAVTALGRIALHAAWVDLAFGAESFLAEDPVPDELRSLWSALGGDAAAWPAAVLKLSP